MPTIMNEGVSEQRESSGLCPVCESPPADRCRLSGPDRLHRTPGTFCVAVCGACGSGWTLPPASAAELASFYPSTYYAYGLEKGFLGVVQRVGQRLIWNRALARPPLRALADLPPGALLDVGCGRGDLGAAFIRRGWRVGGVDPSAEAEAAARARGLDVRAGTLETTTYEDESFDAVVMSHSLEHVTDPRSDLARVYRVLRPGGLLVVSLPNFACWQRERFGSAWFPLELPRHRTHFVPGSLHLALSRTGFEIVSMQTASDSNLLLATLQYALTGRLLLTRVPAAWAAYALAVLVSPIAKVLDRVKGGGPLLHAVARRPALPSAGASGSSPRQAP